MKNDFQPQDESEQLRRKLKTSQNHILRAFLSDSIRSTDRIYSEAFMARARLESELVDVVDIAGEMFRDGLAYSGRVLVESSAQGAIKEDVYTALAPVVLSAALAASDKDDFYTARTLVDEVYSSKNKRWLFDVLNERLLIAAVDTATVGNFAAAEEVARLAGRPEDVNFIRRSVDPLVFDRVSTLMRVGNVLFAKKVAGLASSEALGSDMIDAARPARLDRKDQERFNLYLRKSSSAPFRRRALAGAGPQAVSAIEAVIENVPEGVNAFDQALFFVRQWRLSSNPKVLVNAVFMAREADYSSPEPASLSRGFTLD